MSSQNGQRLGDVQLQKWENLFWVVVIEFRNFYLAVSFYQPTESKNHPKRFF